MLKQFIEFKNLFDDKKIKTTNSKLNKIFCSYSFFHITKESDIDENQIILQNLKESKVAIITQFTEPDVEDPKTYSIVSFANTIIFNQLPSEIIQNKLLLTTPNIAIFDLPITNITKEQKENDHIFTEIDSFVRKFDIKQSINFQIVSNIKKCIAGYLIKEGYANLRCNKESDFFSENESFLVTDFDETDFIEIRNLNNGSSFLSKIFYHIEGKKLCVIKMPSGCPYEKTKLLNRENDNYHSINYYYLPKYYGRIKNKNYPVIEFIDGETLGNINEYNLNDDDKTAIIFQIMMSIKYLHNNKFVYRDLKPNNIIIDNYKRAYLIDFDRVVKCNDEHDYDLLTKDFSSCFVAPEVNYGKIKYENDIYSIGQMIYYIMNEEYPKNKEKITKKSFKGPAPLFQIYSSCINEIEKRPSILELICVLYFYSPKLINNQNIHKDSVIEYFNGIISLKTEYLKKDINKAIHYFSLAANQNNRDAQYNLGVIYESGKYIKQDINKSIHYYSLAANQNHPYAQYNLGLIYYKGEYIKRDINKSIHYFLLAANQNQPDAQYNLGVIYYEGEYIERDINKSIQYYSLAAKQNYSKAQFNLGVIYATGEYIERDINKSIHYFSLAANQNHPDAQYNLGVIYESGKYIERDINKLIHYFLLAANQNYLNAQFNLGVIYYEGKYTERDINRSIHYYSLAANQNNRDAQYNLGVIYESGKYIKQDINKSIHYYSLAANQNHPYAQYNLGLIYYKGEYIKRDINKSIHYFLLAANQNQPDAQYNLGVIYYEGEYIERDINKSIQYYSLAAKQNYSKAQNNLGVIYATGEYIERDINKSIYFFSLAANQNNSNAQCCLGFFYLNGLFLPKNIPKARNYFLLSSMNRCRYAHFYVGFLYHEGKYIKKDIMESIHYYKEGSNLYDQYCKNNLGIIYRYGEGGIEQRLGLTIEYFKEAIRQKNDKISMYNLAHIFIYEDIKDQIYEPIYLLFKSFKQGFLPSKDLLCIELIKKIGNNENKIREILKKQPDSKKSDINSIIQTIQDLHLNNPSDFNFYYDILKDVVYLYDINAKAIQLKDFNKPKEDDEKSKLIKNVSPEFYEGFAHNI